MITKTSEIKAHAKYSASGSERWLACPGSITLSEKAPPQRESKYAAEGTEAHACLELLLKNRLKLSAAIRMAEKKYESEMIDHALEATKWITAKARESKGKIICESKINSSTFLGTPNQFGTLDAAIIDEYGTLVVIDFKYGAGYAVEPENNSQLIYYALGISHVYHHNFKDIELVIIQPRAFHESGNTTRTSKISMKELLSWEKTFKEGVKNCQRKDAELNSGQWCKFCPAALICPEIKNKAMKSAMVVFDDNKGLESVPEPMLIPIKNLGTVLDACEKLESWIDKVKDHAIHMLENGHEVDGFKLVEKRATRKWTDEEAATKYALKAFGKQAFSEPELLSPAQLEKAFSKMGTSKFLLEQWIAKNITNKSTGTTLVRADDKRSAVRTIETIFSAVNEDGGEEKTKRISKKDK